MANYSRREFLRMGTVLAAGFGLGRAAAPALADGLQRIFSGQKRVLWLQGQSCSGCSVSLLNSEDPGPLELLTEFMSLVYHPTISATQGSQAIDTIQKAIQTGGYFLVVEGSIPTKMAAACELGGRPLTTILPDALRRADLVIAAGSCAAFGGIPAGEGNETGAAGVGEFMQSCGIEPRQRLVNCPGCPVHPQSIVGTLAYAASKGYPDVNSELFTPDMFYKNSVHDDCPRFHYWQKQEFAEHFGDEGCLFKLGCLGPLSHTNCPQRQWNGGVNWCIRAGAPCLGCTSPGFARQQAFSFYRKGEKHHAVAYNEQDRKGGAS
ncbi:MAG: hydrogenase small subunit [Phycisphaerae bacterium]|nr:hydrogenase small subunit [Phycisphaerae bacterium]